MLELIVIRHGETDLNREHRFQGQIDAPLNAAGLAQAARLAERLRDEAIDVLLASDLQRAHRTGLTAAERRGQAEVPVDAGWREQAFGALEGLDLPTILDRHPDLWTAWSRHDADYALPGGGESMRAFHDRVMAALARLHAAHAGRRVAVFSHGGVLDILWRAAQALPLHGPRTCEIPNTGLNRLRFDGRRLAIEQWADAGHLHGMPKPLSD